MNPDHRGHDGRVRSTAFPRSVHASGGAPDAFLADRNQTPPPAPLQDPVAPPFPTVRRGYDPDVVDDHLTRLQESLHALRAALGESERRREMAEQHALAVEDEIRAVRSGHLAAPEPEAGFGARAERMLRLAEQEASEVRGQAARSAAELLDRTRQQAEWHRHEAEQKIITETTRIEQQIARRLAETQQREDAVREQMSGARAEAERIRENAARTAESHRAQAAAEVREHRDRVEREVDRARSDAEVELSHLRTLHRRTRGELHRIAGVVQSAIDGTESAIPGRAGAGVGAG